MRDNDDGQGTDECRSAAFDYAVIAVLVALAGATVGPGPGHALEAAVAAVKAFIGGGSR